MPRQHCRPQPKCIRIGTGLPGVTGYRSEVIAEVVIQESEFVRLAEAIPTDKYTWRPSANVRTISEVFLLASATKYNLYRLVRTPTPSGGDTKTLEQPTTDKAKVIATLKAAYAHAKTATRFKFQVQSISKTGAIRGPELRASQVSSRTRRPPELDSVA